MRARTQRGETQGQEERLSRRVKHKGRDKPHTDKQTKQRAGKTQKKEKRITDQDLDKVRDTKADTYNPNPPKPEKQKKKNHTTHSRLTNQHPLPRPSRQSHSHPIPTLHLPLISYPTHTLYLQPCHHPCLHPTRILPTRILTPVYAHPAIIPCLHTTAATVPPPVPTLLPATVLNSVSVSLPLALNTVVSLPDGRYVPRRLATTAHLYRYQPLLPA